MAKVKVKFCKFCGNYTQQTYVGKAEKSMDEKSFDRMATIMTLGAYQISKRLCGEDTPKLWKCEQCQNISKH